eukprot:276275-Chlamydomonas_euryale.AAC.1
MERKGSRWRFAHGCTHSRQRASEPMHLDKSMLVVVMGEGEGLCVCSGRVEAFAVEGGSVCNGERGSLATEGGGRCTVEVEGEGDRPLGRLAADNSQESTEGRGSGVRMEEARSRQLLGEH